MNTAFLETYYETVILPLYKDTVDFSEISWKDHGKVGADAWAHYFEDRSGREYVLLYEDFPGSDYLNDGLSHDIIPCGNEVNVRVAMTPEKQLDNIVGYFTLYAERKR